jgi:hypothetical protein
LTEQPLPEEFLKFLEAIRGKRARIVVEHILQHGFITTEVLESQYGYKHPPRAIRDVREQGVPIETFTVKDAAGKAIAAYRFGDWSKTESGKLGGRQVFSKQLKSDLYQQQSGKCGICLQTYPLRYMQVDHRIPYEISGEPDDRYHLAEYMLVCGSCNRAKSWSCEHCDNVRMYRQPQKCMECYWANPDHYTHIALRLVRRVELIWSQDDVGDYDQLQYLAETDRMQLPDYVKQVLKQHLRAKAASDTPDLSP